MCLCRNVPLAISIKRSCLVKLILNKDLVTLGGGCGHTECHVLYNCRQNLELSNSAMMIKTEEQVVKARKKSRACKRRDRERMLKFIERKKKQEKTDKMINRDSKSIKMSNCDQMKEDAKSLLNRSNECINKLEECNKQLWSYIKDLQVYCKELIKWARESIETKSNENQYKKILFGCEALAQHIN